MTRLFHPDLMARLELEAEAISTVMHQRIERMAHDISNHVANWQPAPCPDEWGTNQERKHS